MSKKLRKTKNRKTLGRPMAVVSSPRTRGNTTGAEDADAVVVDVVMVGRLLNPLTLHLTWGGMEAVVVTPSMLPDHIRITMADNFHPIQDAVEVPLEPVREDILIHIHHSV
jgi:hypothetical protein